MSDIYWLNDDSRQFLQRGYLLPGETAEQRIEDIANKAEEYLKLDGFADKVHQIHAQRFLFLIFSYLV